MLVRFILKFPFSDQFLFFKMYALSYISTITLNIHSLQTNQKAQTVLLDFFFKSKIQLYVVYIPTLNIYTQTGAGQLLRQESAFQAQRPELNRG